MERGIFIYFLKNYFCAINENFNFSTPLLRVVTSKIDIIRIFFTRYFTGTMKSLDFFGSFSRTNCLIVYTNINRFHNAKMLSFESTNVEKCQEGGRPYSRNNHLCVSFRCLKHNSSLFSYPPLKFTVSNNGALEATAACTKCGNFSLNRVANMPA